MVQETYERPEVLLSSPAGELIREAAECQGYQQSSDSKLKDDVQTIGRPVNSLSGIKTTG